MPTVHSREWEHIFSLNTQADIQTVIADAKFNKKRSVRSFAPITKTFPQRVSDQSWFSKGHSHATFSDVIQQMYTIPAMESSATLLETLYAAAFVMGNVSTTQPDSIGSANEYEHTITWQDLGTNKQVRYTSVGEVMGTEWTESYIGAWINSFTLTGNRDDHVTLSREGGARERVSSPSWTTPAITTGAGNGDSFLKTLHGTVSFGLFDSPGLISAEVLNWNLTVSQNAQPFWLMGNSVGEEDFLTEVLIGDQTVSGSFRVKVNATHRARFRDQNKCELQIVCRSPDTIDNNVHSLTITISNLFISSESYDEEGQTVALGLTFDAGEVLKTDGDEQLSLVVHSDINSSELLVNSP